MVIQHSDQGGDPIPQSPCGFPQAPAVGRPVRRPTVTASVAAHPAVSPTAPPSLPREWLPDDGGLGDCAISTD